MVRVWNVKHTAQAHNYSQRHPPCPLRLVLGPMPQSRIIRLVGYRYDIVGLLMGKGTPDSSIQEVETVFGQANPATHFWF